MTLTAPAPTATLAETAPKVLGLLAGYVGHRTVAIGLRSGLIAELAERPGCTADDLAEVRGVRPVLRVRLVPGSLRGRDHRPRRRRLRARRPHRDPAARHHLPRVRGRRLRRARRQPRCSPGSRPSSPAAAGCGGTTPAPSGSPPSPARARPSTHARSPAAWPRCRACPKRSSRDAGSSTPPAAPASDWSGWPPRIPGAPSSASTATSTRSTWRVRASSRRDSATASSWSAARSRTSNSACRRPSSSTTSPCTSAATSTA